MQLDGIHHITATTGNAASNRDFYVRVLGLRLVKKTVNQDDPSVYHLFYADDAGSPGADLTFFEYPGARQGVAGDGMVHTVAWRVADEAAIDFWETRLAGEGVSSARGASGGLTFRDPEGLGLELVIEPGALGEPLRATSREVPAEHALLGFAGVRTYAADPERSVPVFAQVLGFERGEQDGHWMIAGPTRSSWYTQETPPEGLVSVPGAGVVHHVAFADELGEEVEWQRDVMRAGLRPSPVIDRFYFRSIYFHEPSGVLFELATKGPGFTADEDAATLGERLSLPPNFEPLRERIEQTLIPLPTID